MIGGIRRDGVAWLVDREHRKFAFIALPVRGKLDPYRLEPPQGEHFVIDDDHFQAARSDLAPLP